MSVQFGRAKVICTKYTLVLQRVQIVVLEDSLCYELAWQNAKFLFEGF